MKQSQADCVAYLHGQPTRNELLPLILTVSSLTTAVMELAVAIADGGKPTEFMDAARPLVEHKERLNGLMRELMNAGVDPQWDHKA